MSASVSAFFSLSLVLVLLDWNTSCSSAVFLANKLLREACSSKPDLLLPPLTTGVTQSTRTKILKKTVKTMKAFLILPETVRKPPGLPGVTPREAFCAYSKNAARISSSVFWFPSAFSHNTSSLPTPSQLPWTPDLEPLSNLSLAVIKKKLKKRKCEKVIHQKFSYAYEKLCPEWGPEGLDRFILTLHTFRWQIGRFCVVAKNQLVT